MASRADLEGYVGWVRGLFIDVDKVFGAQCWDQWSHYAQWLGVPAWPTYSNAGGSSPHGGWACNVYHNARAAGLEQWFEILPASAIPRPGDVAFWEFGSAWYPGSHVATVLAVTHGGRMLRCLTQNPGAVQIADLIVDGLIGYLRPCALIVGDVDASRTPALTASQKTIMEEEPIMATYFEATANSTPLADGTSRIWAGEGRKVRSQDAAGRVFEATYANLWERSDDGRIRRLFVDEAAAIRAAYEASGRKLPVAQVHGNAIEQMYLVARPEPAL